MRVIAQLLPVLALAACTPSPELGRPATVGTLAGTSWRLVEFQSSDDAIGVVRPSDPSRFTMSLGTDGRVAMQLDCNRANGTWTATPSGPESGSFAFAALAVTRAACPPPNLDQHIARQAEYVRSYVLRGGRLYLSLMADGGSYVWEESGG
jgi:heat shock protein HslJ